MQTLQLNFGSNSTDLPDSLFKFSNAEATEGVELAVDERIEEEHEAMCLRRLAAERQRSAEVRDAERTRIARELHDTLLQPFNALLLKLQTVSELLPARPDEAHEVLRHAIDHAARALMETRDAVQGLRASVVEPDGLVAAVRSLGEKLAADLPTTHAASLHFVVEGVERPLHPFVRDEVYRIASEALRNSLQHSQCTKIEVEIRFNRRRFQLRVRDNGKGISAQALAAGGRGGHYGLCGMRERAELMGGQLNVWSLQDAGTEIELTIAAPRAYMLSSNS